MIFIGLDGCIHRVNPKSKLSENPSKLHLKARSYLAKIFTCDIILEEFELPGGEHLRADFFIPLRRIIIECQGVQHTKPVGYFHKNVLDFGRQLFRDARKAEWCELNNIRLVLLYDGETDKEWREKIYGICDKN